MSDARRDTFDAVAELYDAARPGYPDEAFDDLHVHPGMRCLEVGCGTGQATRSLLARGLDVTCVELGPSLAALAQRNCPAARVVVCSFEDFTDRFGDYDMVFSAQAWHWIPDDPGFPKAAGLLKPGGRLVLVWNVGEGFADGFGNAVREVYRKHTPSNVREMSSAVATQEGPQAKQRIDASGLFGPVSVRTYANSQTHDADQYVALQRTHSDKNMLEPDVREALLADIHRLIVERFNGRVTEHLRTYVFSAAKL